MIPQRCGRIKSSHPFYPGLHLNVRHLAFLCLCSFLLLDDFPLTSQIPAQSSTIASVPPWFVRCAGENAQCTVYGNVRVIYGSASGKLPAPGGSFVTKVLSSNTLCSDAVFGDPAPGQSKACWYGPVDGMPPGSVQGAGGSDYPFYIQNYGLWDGSQRHVVGHYNLNPTLVEAQLRQFYKTGQRNVSLVLWYMPFNTGTTPVDWLYASAVVDSTGGHLSPLLQSNLTAVLRLIQTIGFTQVTIRFDPFGQASPVTWGNTWNEALFEQEEAFEFNTRQVAEAALAGSSVVRNYDLGVELAGIAPLPNGDGTFANGQTPAWTTRLWADYVSRYGKTDSYGFSIAYTFGTLTTAIAQYDVTGTRPNSYAIDDYLGSDLWYIYQELAGANETSKPVTLQEVSYNDTAESANIQSMLPHFPLEIASVNQWPVNNVTGASNAVPPSNYGAYGGGNDTTGTIVVAPCTLAAGQTACSTQASWSTSNASNVALFVNGVQAANLPNIATSLSGTANISLGLGSTSLLLVSSQGALGNATQIAGYSDLAAGQTILASQTVTAMDPTAPVITGAGVGGPNLQSVWATGSNLSSGCSVQLYDANTPGSAAVATLTNVGCSSSSLSFALPAAVSTTYAALTFTVTNPGSSPSAPYSLAIQPIPVLFAAGLGGVNNGAIWATGRNLTASCSVRLYDPASPGSPAIMTQSLLCGSNNLSFTIPAGIQAAYRTLNLLVVNSDWQGSAPVPVTLH